MHRRHLAAVAELGGRVYVVHPDLQRRWKGWDARVVHTLESSFEDLAELQEESGVNIAIENLPFVRHTHFRAPGDLDLKGLGLSLDVGHAAVTGTLAAWLADGTTASRTCTCTTTRGTWAGTSTCPWGAASSTRRP